MSHVRKLLISNPHTHPIIYLRGIENEELHCLLQFFYFGEVMVSQSRLKKFFHAAKDLEITDIDDNCDDCDVILESYDEKISKPEDVIVSLNSSLPENFIYNSKNLAR